MADTLGYIEVLENHDFRGQIVRRNYEFHDGPMAIVSSRFFDYKEYKPGDIVQLGQYRLKIIEYRFFEDGYKVINTGSQFWQLSYLWHRYNKRLDIAYRRFIITLAIWQLADYNDAVIPTWTDIRIIKKIRSKFNE